MSASLAARWPRSPAPRRNSPPGSTACSLSWGDTRWQPGCWLCWRSTSSLVGADLREDRLAASRGRRPVLDRSHERDQFRDRLGLPMGASCPRARLDCRRVHPRPPRLLVPAWSRMKANGKTPCHLPDEAWCFLANASPSGMMISPGTPAPALSRSSCSSTNDRVRSAPHPALPCGGAITFCGCPRAKASMLANVVSMIRWTALSVL